MKLKKSHNFFLFYKQPHIDTYVQFFFINIKMTFLFICEYLTKQNIICWKLRNILKIIKLVPNQLVKCIEHQTLKRLGLILKSPSIDRHCGPNSGVLWWQSVALCYACNQNVLLIAKVEVN